MSILDRPLTTIAFCWRIVRRDGVAMGFTSHDRDLWIGGLRYRSAPGILPSAVSLSDGFDAESLEVSGALTSDAITAEDLAAGRWDGAEASLFMVDWEEPAVAPIRLVTGELGAVAIRRSGFEAELLGPAAKLERAVVERTSPECRAALGDKRCRVDMAPRTTLARIVAVTGGTALEVSVSGLASAYRSGRLRWLSGGNCGLDVGVADSDGSTIVLREPPHHPAAAGDVIELREGCDKSLATCSARFGNVANFRGEPHLPGMDLLTRYPGA